MKKKTDYLTEIYNSYFNGQKKQMCEQINEMGIYSFINALDVDPDISTATKYKILFTYLIIENR